MRSWTDAESFEIQSKTSEIVYKAQYLKFHMTIRLMQKSKINKKRRTGIIGMAKD